MNPRINEIIVKYIECINCSYERSCPLPETPSCKHFDWVCPECRISLSGIIEEDGNIRIMVDTEYPADEDYILVMKNKELTPWIMLAQKRNTNETGEQSNGSSATLYLFPVEACKIENPRSFPLFRAVSGE